MITRKATLAIAALIIILTGCMADTPQYTITESAHEIVVCSDTATATEIEAHVAATYEYGTSTGLTWTANQNCVVYHK